MVALGWVGVGATWSNSTTAVVVAAAGALLVVTAAVHRLPVTGHMGLAGHVAGAGGLAVALVVTVDAATRAGSHPLAGPWTWWTVTALALVAAGWAVTTAVGEIRGGAVRDLLVRLWRAGASGAEEEATVTWDPARGASEDQWGAGVAPALLLASAAAAAPAVLAASGTLAWSNPWVAVAAAGVVFVAVLGARFLASPRRLPATVFAVEGLVAAPVLAARAASDGWAGTVGAAVVVAAVVAVGPRLRRSWMDWLAWVASDSSRSRPPMRSECRATRCTWCCSAGARSRSSARSAWTTC